MPPGPLNKASFDFRSRLARESRRDFPFGSRPLTDSGTPHSDKQRAKGTAGPSAHRRSAASCSAATPLLYTLFCNFTQLALERDERHLQLSDPLSNALRASRNPHCAEKFWLWWVVCAGPPKTLVTNMGTSFPAAFLTLAVVL